VLRELRAHNQNDHRQPIDGDAARSSGSATASARGASPMPRSGPRPSPWPGSCTNRAWAIGRSGDRCRARAAGHVNERGKPFHHKSVRAMLE
jgi:hypothetical protein